jgi:hypothetical protein
MCGIFGFSRVTDVTKQMAIPLMWEMEDRGRDSWGCSNGIEWIKQIGPITKTWRKYESEWHQWERAIFHTRAASQGKVSIENQHPFRIDHTEEDQSVRTLVGIHNGVVSNHDQLNAKYKRDFDCDTPHIYMALAGFSPTQEIHGYGNLAWYDYSTTNPTPILHFLHFNAGNLNVAKLESGEMVFCSTKDPIDRAADFAGTKIDRYFHLEGDKIYWVELNYQDVPGSDMLIAGPKQSFGGRSIQGTGCATPWDGHRPVGLPLYEHIAGANPRRMGPSQVRNTNISELGSEDRQNNICLNNQCKNKVKQSRRKQLLCETCLVAVKQNLAYMTTIHDRVRGRMGGAE